MNPPKPATGFQIAFLAFAVIFLLAAFAPRIAAAIGWPGGNKGEMGRALTILSGGIALVCIPALRRFSIAQLKVALPSTKLLEISIVSLSKLALPFAISGAFVLWAMNVDDSFDFFRQLDLHESLSEIQSSSPPWMQFIYFAMAWVFAPIVEELLFRGVLYRAWERQWGWIPSMLLTSILFGVGHPSHMTSSFIASVLFVCVLRRTGTLWGPIIVHGTFNFLVSFPPYLELLFVKPKAEAAILSNWTFEFACLAFVIVALPTYIWAARGPRQPASMGTHVST